MSKDEDMQRTLCVEFGGLSVQWDKLTDDYEPLATGSGWTYVTPGFWYLQQDIDLSGYAMDRKTFYPYSSFEQRGMATLAEVIPTGGATTLTKQPYVYDITIVSSVPLKQNDLIASVLAGPGFTTFAGFPNGEGRFNRSQIIHGETKMYTVDYTTSVIGSNQQDVLKLVNRDIYSSLEPTAADKLYCYRIVALTAEASEIDAAFVPATRVLIPGNISSEPKLEYMMRLKRSYELANQV